MKKIGIIFICLLCSFGAHSQFVVGGQLLQRAEYRHGYGKLIGKSQQAAIFVGHRARLHAEYKHDKVRVFVSIQDIRTWGSASQAKESDNFLSVHEAYAELPLDANWKIKLGRQELNYDNVRFLGNLDWALQARAHDFALAKFEKETLKLHFGLGYNQVKESLARQPFTVPNQYKTAHFARAEQQWGKFYGSLLFWNNGVEENDQGDLKIRYTQTLGLPTLRFTTGNIILSGFYYFQTGADTTGRQVRAHNVNGQVTWKQPGSDENGKSFQATAGFELLTGTSRSAGDNKNRSFNPLYGTNHAHNGYMDFFYVGNRHTNSVGLQDYFLRLRYDPSARVFVSLNGHQFYAAARVLENGKKVSRRLGFETDFSVGLILNEIISIQGGYSQAWQTGMLELLQGVNDPASIQHWAYAMLLVRPNMKNRFVGLLF